MLTKAPALRITLPDIMAHPWVTAEGTEALPLISYVRIDLEETEEDDVAVAAAGATRIVGTHSRIQTTGGSSGSWTQGPQRMRSRRKSITAASGERDQATAAAAAAVAAATAAVGGATVDSTARLERRRSSGIGVADGAMRLERRRTSGVAQADDGGGGADAAAAHPPLSKKPSTDSIGRVRAHGGLARRRSLTGASSIDAAAAAAAARQAVAASGGIATPLASHHKSLARLTSLAPLSTYSASPAALMPSSALETPMAASALASGSASRLRRDGTVRKLARKETSESLASSAARLSSPTHAASMGLARTVSVASKRSAHSAEEPDASAPVLASASGPTPAGKSASAEALRKEHLQKLRKRQFALLKGHAGLSAEIRDAMMDQQRFGEHSSMRVDQTANFIDPFPSLLFRCLQLSMLTALRQLSKRLRSWERPKLRRGLTLVRAST